MPDVSHLCGKFLFYTIGDWDKLSLFQDKSLTKDINPTNADLTKYSIEKNTEDVPFLVGCELRLPVLFLSFFMEYSKAYHVPMSVPFNY